MRAGDSASVARVSRSKVHRIHHVRTQTHAHAGTSGTRAGGSSSLRRFSLWSVSVSSQATHIQRLFRGHLGRSRFLAALHEREYAIQLSLYSAMAVKIQKVMRGYLSRKFAQDVYARRAWIARVAERGTQLEQAADDNLERQLIESDAAATQARAEKFETLTSNIHHLVGTRAIPSVFQSRLGPEYDATAFDIPMEAHIREAFQNRQAQLRKMRHQIFHPASTTQPQQQLPSSQSIQQQQQQPARYSSLTAPSPPLSSSPSSVRSSSAGSRASRPTSAGRLAPLPVGAASAAAAATASLAQTQARGAVTANPARSLDSPSGVHLTQKLPQLRASQAHQSGRTVNAADLHASKISGLRSPDLEEEKQQIPLALAMGGHVSTSNTPTPAGRIMKPTENFAQTRQNLASPNRKWAQPSKPQIQKTEA